MAYREEDAREKLQRTNPGHLQTIESFDRTLEKLGVPLTGPAR